MLKSTAVVVAELNEETPISTGHGMLHGPSPKFFIDFWKVVSAHGTKIQIVSKSIIYGPIDLLGLLGFYGKSGRLELCWTNITNVLTKNDFWEAPILSYIPTFQNPIQSTRSTILFTYLVRLSWLEEKGGHKLADHLEGTRTGRAFGIMQCEHPYYVCGSGKRTELHWNKAHLKHCWHIKIT